MSYTLRISSTTEATFGTIEFNSQVYNKACVVFHSSSSTLSPTDPVLTYVRYPSSLFPTRAASILRDQLRYVAGLSSFRFKEGRSNFIVCEWTDSDPSPFMALCFISSIRAFTSATLSFLIISYTYYTRLPSFFDQFQNINNS
jgi:hypothetical protein